jgi:hypothetical protein
MNADTDRSGRALLELVSGLGVRFGRERSFRLSPGLLLKDRYLLSMSRTSLGAGAARAITDICRHLGMPEEVAGEVRDLVERADFVHLGCEGTGQSQVHKVYLERLPDRKNGPIVLHRAYKWVAGQAAVVRTRYTWHPDLSEDQILKRMEGVSGEIAGEILGLAVGRMSGPVRYMEVEEEGSPRRSFDLNLYDAGLAVEDLLPQLGCACAAFSILPSGLFGFVESIGKHRLGHVAGGLHRRGEPFLTIYHGIEAFP